METKTPIPTHSNDLSFSDSAVNTHQPTRFCKYCGTAIRFECHEDIKIVNSNSIFHWELKKTKRYSVLDFYTRKKHRCRMKVA